jgi:Protein of unknown function (DUF4019)
MWATRGEKNLMKIAIVAICFWLSLAALAKPQAMVEPATDGRDVALKWLALIDSGGYGKCWDLAATPLQSSVTKAGWILGMSRARRFYGKVLSRKFKETVYATNPPGFPPGEYEILQFKVRFSARGEATEFVSMKMQTDGQWLVAGYHIELKNAVRTRPLEFLYHR